MTTPSEFPPPLELPLLAHLIELRDRLLRSVVAIAAIFLCLFYFANDLFTLLAAPLIQSMVPGTKMIATGVASPFLTPFKLTLAVSIFIAVPYLLFEIWGFVAPALYRNEKRLVFPLLVSSTALFYVGMAFAYFVVFPLVFKFFTGVGPEGVAVTPDISLYLDFVLVMFFAFGVAFEVPIATILVIWSGLITAEDLAKQRPYIIVAAFVIGAFLTPPDVLSQTLLAVPMWLLFECGLLMSRFYVPKETEPKASAESEPGVQSPARKPAGTAVKPGPSAAATTVATSPETEPEAPHRRMSETEMDAELDRIAAEERAMGWVQDEQGPHEEFEPIAEERERLAKKTDSSNAGSSNATNDAADKDVAENTEPAVKKEDK